MNYKKLFSLLLVCIMVCCGAAILSGCTTEEEIASTPTATEQPEAEEDTTSRIPEVCENTGFDAWYEKAMEYCVEEIINEMAPNFADLEYTWDSNYMEERFLQEDGSIRDYEYYDEEQYREISEYPYIEIIFENGAELRSTVRYIISKDRSEAQYDEFTGELLNPIYYGDLQIGVSTDWTRVSPDGTTESYDMFDNRNDELYLSNHSFDFSCDIEGDRHVYTDGDIKRLVCGCGVE